MLAIKDIASGEFFNIPSELSLEIERANPYLGTDEISGENTLPINIFYTDRNYRLIGYYGNHYKRNQKLQIAVEIYDNTNYKYTGTLVIQAHTSNLNTITNTVWVGIVTFNASSFFQDAKNKFLHQIDLGGTRTFPWTTSNPNDGSGGFWQHIHDARTPDLFDYVFYPVFNPSWVPQEFAEPGSTLGMNVLGPGNTFFYPISGVLDQLFNAYSIVPMIYVSYILKKIFDAIGWTLDGEILNDPGFKKLTLVGTRAIPWNRIPWYEWFIIQPPTVSWDLKDYVTEDITLYKFLIDLKNRFGWKFTFNSNTKTAKLTSLKTGISSARNNWTAYVVGDYKADYKAEAQNFSLINNIDSNDTFPLSADTESPVTLAPVAEFSLLPDANTTDENVICYSFKENTWYQNTFDFSTFSIGWQEYSHNVGNYVEPDPSNRIESDISTMPTLLRKIVNQETDALLPTCDYLGNHENFTTQFTNLGMRVLFYHGMKHDSAGNLYPYASCHCTDYDGNTNLTPWSIPYRLEYGAINNGVYDYWFKEWLDFIKSDDIRTFRFALPLYILAQFDWNTVIRINDVDFVPVSYKEILPYTGMIEFKLKRVN